MQTNPRNAPEEFTLSCEEFARLNQIKPQSVRANGRLAFPAVQVAQ